VETGAVNGVLNMIIFCEECGERYVIEQHTIKEEVIMFNCRICKYLINITTPNTEALLPSEGETKKS
jgi:hypothetical protein